MSVDPEKPEILRTILATRLRATRLNAAKNQKEIRRPGNSPLDERLYDRLNNQLTNDGTYSYIYDDEGNRLTRTNDSTSESTEYTWDFRNRLTKVTEKDSYGSATQVVEYTYDVFNRRIGKAIDTTSPFRVKRGHPNS